MKIKLLTATALIGGMLTISANVCAADSHAAQRKVDLSADLLELLRAEMREITTGIQIIASSLATADWKSIQDTSTKIRASYILEKNLTPAQAGELKKVLPERFKQFDAEFHQRAEKLGAAASSHDAELLLFHYTRLVESCVRCHSEFAGDRFPGFTAPTALGHHH